MSIATAIQAAQQKVANAYTTISNKGGTLPQTQNLANLPTAINSIPTGTTPTGTIAISQNGTYDVTNYASANVNVSSTPTTRYGLSIDNILGLPDASGNYQKGTNFTETLSFDGIKTIPANGMYYMFAYLTNLRCDVIFPDLESVLGNGLSYAFAYSNVTSLSFPKVTTISGNSAFNYIIANNATITSISFPELVSVTATNGLSNLGYGCNSITSVSLPKLKSATNISSIANLVYSCRSITSFELPELESITGSTGGRYLCAQDTSLTTVRLPKLNTLTGTNALQTAFYGDTALRDVYFNGLRTTSFGATYKTQFTNMMQGTGTSVTHTLHFPSNMEATISTLTGYPLFGGSSGYVVCAFDLPATS